MNSNLAPTPMPQYYHADSASIWTLNDCDLGTNFLYLSLYGSSSPIVLALHTVIFLGAVSFTSDSRETIRRAFAFRLVKQHPCL